MKKDFKIFLEHIKESIEEIERHTENMSEKEFMDDTKTQDAVFRRIEIIGEAVKNIPPDFKRKNTQVEWREIAGTRDKLIHEYFGVDLDLVWEIINKDIPKLKKQILKILETLNGKIKSEHE